MKQYRPTLADLPDGGVEQSFDANVVNVEDDLVAFGDLIPDPSQGLPYGTPVHSLLLHMSENGLETVEFNDQGNSVEVDAVERIDLTRDQVRLTFRKGARLFAGRVRLAREIEVFEEASPAPSANCSVSSSAAELAALRVRFDIDEARFEALRDKLAVRS